MATSIPGSLHLGTFFVDSNPKAPAGKKPLSTRIAERLSDRIEADKSTALRQYGRLVVSIEASGGDVPEDKLSALTELARALGFDPRRIDEDLKAVGDIKRLSAFDNDTLAIAAEKRAADLQTEIDRLLFEVLPDLRSKLAVEQGQITKFAYQSADLQKLGHERPYLLEAIESTDTDDSKGTPAKRAKAGK